jgi:hypothetical protein
MPALRLAIDIIATAIIEIETIEDADLDGTARTNNAPKIEPTNIKTIKSGKRLIAIASFPVKSNVLPTLIKVKANILVDNAVRGSIPNSSITGTVIKDVLQAIALTILAIKKITHKIRT